MTNPATPLPAVPKHIGIAADHGGFEVKEYLVRALREAGYEVTDFGNSRHMPDDDYPEFVVPLACAVARGSVDRGVALCGSGVGACIAANKIPGVRAALIAEPFAARQGVEHDHMNVICLAGRVLDGPTAWELTRIFLSARFSGAERHLRRLAALARLDIEG